MLHTLAWPALLLATFHENVLEFSNVATYVRYLEQPVAVEVYYLPTYIHVIAIKAFLNSTLEERGGD